MQLRREVEKDASQHDEQKDERPSRSRGHKLSLTCVCVDSKDKYAFTGSKDGSIIKWCLQTRKILNKINSIKRLEAESDESLRKKYHVKHINSIAISSDDKFLATGGWDKLIRIWSPTDMTWLHTFDLHRREVTALVFRQGHPTLYSGSADRSVMLWTLEDNDNMCFVEALYGHESTVTSMDALRKERVVSSGGRDQSLRIWKIVEQAQTVFQSKHESVDIVRFIDDKTFVSGGEDGAITIWTTMKRSPLYSLSNAHISNKSDKQVVEKNYDQADLKYWINALATFPLKDSKLARATKRQKLDRDLDEKVTEFDGDDDEEGSSASDNDGNEQIEADTKDNVLALIASGSCDSQLNIWKLTKNESKFGLQLHQSHNCPGFINDLRFSSDGSKIIVACGQEHRFGRWWKLKGAAKNCMRIFDVDKCS